MTVDPSNNVWAADTGNNRIEEFNEKGEFIAAIGKDVNKTKVTSSGTEAERNFCSAASGNVCQPGPEGTAAGQLKAPQGIVATCCGSVWVADTGHNRLEKFTATGGILNNSFAGEVKEPTAIAIGPAESIWAADTGNNRIIEWNRLCQFVRSIGIEGSGNGQFKHPDALEVDSTGNVWVGDEGNNRIQEFSESGEFLGKFGSQGAGNGQFSFAAPLGLSLGNGGLLVVDSGNNRVEKWQPALYSESTIEVAMDGTTVSSGAATCEALHCAINREWTLENAAVGNHTIVTKATDGLGNTTTKTLNIQITPDTVKPSLEVGGTLFNAPEGWVEQEGYGFSATAKDSGYGVTSLSLKIDGQVVAQSVASCPDGGCERSIQKTISMGTYVGGSHPAEIIATDGAGNSTVQRWTINVDPKGKITAAEAVDTLEAADETSESSVVASTGELLEPGQIESGDNPGLAKIGSSISSTGVPDSTTMGLSLANGFTIETPEGNVTIVPSVGGSTANTTVASGVAGVAANAGTEADMIVRPEYDGDETFEAIRSAVAQHVFSWTVQLHGEQHLELVNSEYAQVVYPSGDRAFLITAEAAHDAVGNDVPSALSVKGNVLTLTVDLSAPSIVYPVRAGQGWEGGYRAPVIVEGPEDEKEVREREEREAEAREREREEEESGTEPQPPAHYYSRAEAERTLLHRSQGGELIPAPEPGTGGASVSSVPERVVKPLKACEIDSCHIWWIEIRNPSYIYGLIWLHSDKGRKFLGFDAAWHSGTQVHCEKWSNPIFVPELEVHLNDCNFYGPNIVYTGEERHLTIYGRFTVEAGVFLPPDNVFVYSEQPALQTWVWPNGYQQRKVKTWSDGITES